MNYLKSLFFNFLTVFFANHLLPGIEVVKQSKLPHIGGDLLFAIVLGFLNSLIFPVLKVMDQKISVGRIAITASVLSFAAYAVLKFAPLGIEIKTVEGYLLAAGFVGAGGFLTNYLEMKRAFQFPKPPEMPKI